MKFSTETLMAYVDGELEPDARAEIEAAGVEDPEVAAAIAAQRASRDALQAKLQTAFAGSLSESVPERLLAAAASTPKASASDSAAVISLETARTASPKTRRWSYVEWGAIAATLLLGVFVGRMSMQPDDWFVAENGRMRALGQLDEALTTRAGGSIDRRTGVQIGVSFLARGGEYCRTFTLKQQQTLAGLACRRDAGWTIDALARTKTDAVGTYRMANTPVPGVILGIIEDTIDGDPLDAEQEAEARDHGWQR